MKHPFRPVAFWQSALMTLPDSSFFDLLRSILGSVKTPYNKQNLIEELSRFITRPEIQETMAAYIDNNDRKIIAAIALLSEPVPGELESFFTGEYSYTELQSMLLNLEERLIIYRFKDNNVQRIALNPRLENILAPHAANTGILFPALTINETAASEGGSEDGSKDKPKDRNENSPAGGSESAAGTADISSGTLNGRTLAALFAYLVNSDMQIRDEGNGKGLTFAFRKKATEQGKALFPGLDLNAAIGGLLTLGILVRGEGEDRSSASITPDEARIAGFKALSDQERSEYLAGSIALFLHRGDIPPSYQYRNLLRNTVSLIHSLCSIAKDGSILPEATMIKLAELFRRQEEGNWSSAEAIPPASVLLQSLVMVGVFSVVTIGGVNCYKPVNPSLPSNSSKAKNPSIAMDSGFSCVLYPEIDFADALDLAAFSTVEETGTTVRFSLSRDSAVGGFNRGYTAEFLWELLDRLSGGRTPEALKWNLDDWAKRWQEVSLNQGVILTLSGERSYLAKTEPLASMIKQCLAPGVFLLNASVEDAAGALRDAGVDIIARPEVKKKALSSYFSPLGKSEAIPLPEKSLDEPSAEHANIVEQIKERFRLALEKMKLTKQEQEELESRIERRVVVSETQLKDISLRYEKLEARSLDYVGKTGIVRQAISTGSILELSCLTGEKILGVPETLDKKGTDMIITIRPREGGEPIKLPLGKISLVRRIKQSIFGA